MAGGRPVDCELISCGLFGDGAAAVVVRAMRWRCRTRSWRRASDPGNAVDVLSRYRAHRRMEIGARGSRLCTDVPKVVTENLREDVRAFWRQWCRPGENGELDLSTRRAQKS